MPAFEALFPPRTLLDPTPHRPLAVAYSAGKDSLAVMQLAVERYGPESIIGVYWYICPGLDHTRAMVDDATQRWGVRIIEVPHFALSSWLRDGTFCDPTPSSPRLKLKDLERAVYRSTGATFTAYGYRKQESLERNAMLTRDFPGGYSIPWRRLAPIMLWSRRTTLAFLKQRDLPVPSEQATRSGRATNVDLRPGPLWWLRKFWPADYRRILEVFPYAAAQADRYDPATGKVR